MPAGHARGQRRCSGRHRPQLDRRSGRQAQLTRKCPKTGCGGSPTLLSQATELGGTLGPRQLVVDEDNVYWLAAASAGSIGQRSYIWKCSTAGCSLSPSQHGDYAAGGALVGNATHLFRYDPTGTLYKYPKANTTPADLTGLYLSSSYGFAVDATTIAFTNTDTSIRACGVYTAAITASSPTKIMDVGYHIAMAGGVVYASRNLNASQSTIHRCPVGGGCGGTGTALFPNPDGEITYVAVDASGVYWTVKGSAGSATGAVRRCAIPDCAGGPKDIAKDEASPAASRSTASSSTGRTKGRARPTPARSCASGSDARLQREDRLAL